MLSLSFTHLFRNRFPFTKPNYSGRTLFLVTTLVAFILFLTAPSYGQTGTYVKGRVTDNEGNPLPFSSVYVKNTTYGVNTNMKGNYFLEVKPGNHTLVFHFLGFKPVEKQLTLVKGKPQSINVTLWPTATNIGEVEVIVKPKKEGRRIVRMAIDKRREYLTAVNSYQCKTYLKSSLKKETPQTMLMPDSMFNTIKDESLRADMKKYFSNQKLNLIESVSELYYKAPERYKEIIKGHHDFAEHEEESNFNLSVTYSDDNIIPSQTIEHNPYILYKDITSGDFNFYKNSIDFPAVCQKPILSPIASTAMLSYNYRYDQAFKDSTGKKIYKIEVIPRFNTEALFSGYIYIEDSTWALKSVDLSINEAAMYMSQHFQVIQNYDLIDGKYYLPVRREFSYTLKDGFFFVLGNTRIHHNDYKVNIDFERGLFGNELIRYEDDAFDKDSAFWNNERTIQLEEDEMEYIEKIDSIEEYYTSDEYYAKIDSQFNEINWWSLLNGIGHRNRKKGTEWWLNGLLEQPNFFGIGGYRHKLGGYFSYDLMNTKQEKDLKLEADGFVDYGFRNRDVKGELGIGINYNRLKFMRTYVRVGDVYDMVNSYESIEATFSRSNYVRKQTFMISQRMEIVNGLFAEASFNYSDQIPLVGLEFANWSNWLFGNLNNARDFTRYKKSEFKLELRFKPMQKYIIKKGRKILLDTKYPQFALEYRHGIPDLFNSEVNYSYLELSARDDIKLKRFGSSRWQVSTGTYLNQKDLRLLENKFFRGSDLFIFSDPIFSFQHLDRTYSTNKEWFAANYIHHFEGSVISKVPILSKMKFQLAGGAGTLVVKQPGATDLAHVELFAGLERPFKIKKDLFRWGLYMVSSSSTINPGIASNLKFGITYFDSINKKWGY